jgi:hypothetical protein
MSSDKPDPDDDADVDEDEFPPSLTKAERILRLSWTDRFAYTLVGWTLVGSFSVVAIFVLLWWVRVAGPQTEPRPVEQDLPEPQEAALLYMFLFFLFTGALSRIFFTAMTKTARTVNHHEVLPLVFACAWKAIFTWIVAVTVILSYFVTGIRIPLVVFSAVIAASSIGLITFAVDAVKEARLGRVKYGAADPVEPVRPVLWNGSTSRRLTRMWASLIVWQWHRRRR